jgi:hypothetical protein
MQDRQNIQTHDHALTKLLALAALVLVLAALLVGPAGAAQSEYANSGWYTGLEYKDLPQSQATVQDEHSNSGWYTGLEHRDMPQLQASSQDGDGLPQETTFGLAAAAAALLLVGTIAATRSRKARTAPC